MRVIETIYPILTEQMLSLNKEQQQWERFAVSQISR
ncbi:MAG: hypothetical protein H6Q13_2609 [Bacteroidetes bacterium]|nr:hypothetical protein [Bacteroidota bacterium]